MKIYTLDRWDKRGGPLWVIYNLLSRFYDIKFEVYNKQKNGVYLATNVIPLDMYKRSISKVLYIGGCRMTENGVPRKQDWKKFKHIIFNSKFHRRIAHSAYTIKKSSIIYMVGGAPSDPNLAHPLTTKKLSFPLHFMISAKWWKRPFKRKSQSIKLFSSFIRKKYPGSILHILGNRQKEDTFDKKNGIYYYKKTFHNKIVQEVYKKSHIQLILTPFDTGPMTLSESMHYRVPFVCANNCAGSEYLSLIDGKCGEVVNIDPPIRRAKDCKKFKPMTNKKFYGKKLNYEMIMERIVYIVENYNEYTNWNWGELDYKNLASKWKESLSV